MITLHLGVIDQPYTTPPEDDAPVPKARKGRQRPRKKKPPVSGLQTTGDVATQLEEKYHVMETFYDLHELEIADQFAESMAGALENLIAGAPPTNNPLGAAMDDIQSGFKLFLENEEMDATATPGVPTRAARRGVNHRLKIKRGEPRASFIDTGLYEASFIAWVDQR